MPVKRIDNDIKTYYMTPIMPDPQNTDSTAHIIRLMEPVLNELDKSVRHDTGLFMSLPDDSLAADIAFNSSRRLDAGKYPSPAAFRSTLPSTRAAEIAITFGLGGPLVVFCDPPGGNNSLACARRWIFSGAISLAVVINSPASTPFINMPSEIQTGSRGFWTLIGRMSG